MKREKTNSKKTELTAFRDDIKRHFDVKTKEVEHRFDVKTQEVKRHFDVKTEETKRHFDVVAEAQDKKWEIVAEQFLGVVERLDRLTADSAIIKEQVDLINSNLTHKVDRAEFEALQRRVATLEKVKK